MASRGRIDPAGHGPAQPKGWRIASRMRIIVAVPLVAVIGFAGVALIASIRQADQASELGQRVRLAADAGDLAYELQLERAAAAGLLSADEVRRQAEFTAQTAQTDAVVARYRAHRAEITDEPAGTRAILARVDRSIDGLAPLRTQVRTAAQASVSAMTFSYRIAIADLLAYRESTAQGITDTGISDGLRAAAALSRTAEAVGQEQVAVLRAVAAGQLTPALQQDISASRAGFTEASLSFLDLARPAWRVWWEQAGSGAPALALQRMQDQVSRARPGTRLRLDTDAWITATQDWVSRQLGVQRDVDAAIRASVEGARGHEQRRAAAEAVAMAFAILLTLAITGAVARQITRRLRRLRDAANEIAFSKLPAMVAELRAAGSAPVEPEVLAASTQTDLEGTADEIGDVGKAFSAVHRAAVHTAAEQAVLRANTAQIFIHLSRREQRLVDAVLAQVDRVERDETDPDRLDRLYTLDHLATRMARINASLLVLGGVGVGRVRHADVSLAEILQAALSQIEHYRRVRLGVVDSEVAVAAESVDEVVHLLAELMDNATSYSPPDTEAWATGRSLGDRVIVQIGDEGVGLPAQRLAQLNQLLSAPPAVDVAAVRAMGLVVVGQLAARLGAHVELRPGPKLGTIAEVTLPAALVRPAPRDLELATAGNGGADPAAPGQVLYAGAGRSGNGYAAPVRGDAGAGGGEDLFRAGNGRRGPATAAADGGDPLTDRLPERYGPPAAGRQLATGHQLATGRQPSTGHELATGYEPSAEHRGYPGGRGHHPQGHQGYPGGPGHQPHGQQGYPGGPGHQPVDRDGRQAPAGHPPGGPQGRAVRPDDITQELPIFQQVNTWFRAESGASGGTGPAGNGTGNGGTGPSANGTGNGGTGPAGNGGTADGAGAVGPGAAGAVAGDDGKADRERRAGSGDGWHTPADEAWRTAAEAASPEIVATTAAGLPVRIPQRHLVPGGINSSGNRAQDHRRDPSKVAAAMSAYARGVAGRRPAMANAAASTEPTGGTQ